MASSENSASRVDGQSVLRLAGRITGWAIGIAIAAFIVHSLATNEGLQWDRVRYYLFDSRILFGLWVTIQLTVISGLLALLVGIGLVIVSNGGHAGRILVASYVWIFRSVPLLVQLIFWFNLAIVVPRISVGIPGGGNLLEISTNELITGFVASMLGLALHEAAYFAEILRGGLLAVPEGQYRAAAALGMTRFNQYRYIIGPQMMRVTVPALTNQMIGLLKATSMVAVIGGGELLTRAQWIYSQNFQIVPLLIVVTIWYIVLVGLATFLQHIIERRMTVRGAKPIEVKP